MINVNTQHCLITCNSKHALCHQCELANKYYRSVNMINVNTQHCLITCNSKHALCHQCELVNKYYRSVNMINVNTQHCLITKVMLPIMEHPASWGLCSIYIGIAVPIYNTVHTVTTVHVHTILR